MSDFTHHLPYGNKPPSAQVAREPSEKDTGDEDDGFEKREHGARMVHAGPEDATPELAISNPDFVPPTQERCGSSVTCTRCGFVGYRILTTRWTCSCPVRECTGRLRPTKVG